MQISKVEYREGQLILSTTDYEARRFVFNFKPGDYDITKARKARSLDSNKYAWALIGKMADVLRTGKDEVYLEMLKRYGQSELISIRSDINVKGYFRYYETFGNKAVNGEYFTDYRVYKGSSEYDTREMSVLIDGIVSECKALEIETLSEDKLSILKESWK